MARTAEDILKEAILLEMRGKSFYTNVAEKTDSKSAKQIFEQMAAEEDEHIAFLSNQFQNYVKNKEFLGIDEVEETADDEVAMKVLSEELRKEISAAGFEAAAISSAIDFENRAVELYAGRAKEATDPAEKKIYEMLARWEEGHAKSLNQINDALKEDIWNDHNFWPF
jgi:rubrerythrin